MPVIDPSTEFGAKVAKRLDDELIIWLTTAGANGTPHPRPVWFLWNGEAILLYSQPDTAKIRHIGRDGRVALNFNTDAHGGDVAVINGNARMAPDAPAAINHPAYLKKYDDAISELGQPLNSFSAGYSVAIRIVPAKLWGF